MATRAAKSMDFPELLAALCGIAAPTDEVTMANTYAGTTGKSVRDAINSKAGTTGLDLAAAFRVIAGTPRGTDVNTSIKAITG